MYEITFHLEDGMETVAVGSDEYVLDAAERAGLELPHSCRNGMCTSCAGELLEGELDGREGTALTLNRRTTATCYCVVRTRERTARSGSESGYRTTCSDSTLCNSEQSLRTALLSCDWVCSDCQSAGWTSVTVPTPLLRPSRKTNFWPSSTRYGRNLNRTVVSPVSPGRSRPFSG